MYSSPQKQYKLKHSTSTLWWQLFFYYKHRYMNIATANCSKICFNHKQYFPNGHTELCSYCPAGQTLPKCPFTLLMFVQKTQTVFCVYFVCFFASVVFELVVITQQKAHMHTWTHWQCYHDADFHEESNKLRAHTLGPNYSQNKLEQWSLISG